MLKIALIIGLAAAIPTGVVVARFLYKYLSFKLQQQKDEHNKSLFM